jgi:hypothetical protein
MASIPIPQEVWAQDLATIKEAPATWLWQGFVARGNVTLLTSWGMAVLLLHHPAKGDNLIGQAARGSGALLGHVDISIEMRHPGGDPFTRRRRFLALSRHAETPRQLLLELNPEGSDYVPVPDEPDTADQAGWQACRTVLEGASQKLTRQDILALWPVDLARPDPATLWKWLNRAVKCNQVARDGSGTRNDPYRYWLPGKEAEFPVDSMQQLYREQEAIEQRLRALG